VSQASHQCLSSGCRLCGRQVPFSLRCSKYLVFHEPRHLLRVRVVSIKHLYRTLVVALSESCAHSTAHVVYDWLKLLEEIRMNRLAFSLETGLDVHVGWYCAIYVASTPHRFRAWPADVACGMSAGIPFFLTSIPFVFVAFI
jgi:hypothetical protein